MLKKTLLPAVILSVLLLFSSVVYAEPNRSVARRLDVTTFQLTKNLDGTKTFERNQVISGRAENGSEITMTILWFNAEEDKGIISKKKTTDDSSEASGQWIVQDKFGWEVGASGIFAKPVTLNMGKNKINIHVKEKDGDIKDEVINVEVVQKNELTDFINSIFMKNLKK
jgi:hypothetical protein